MVRELIWLMVSRPGRWGEHFWKTKKNWVELINHWKKEGERWGFSGWGCLPVNLDLYSARDWAKGINSCQILEQNQISGTRHLYSVATETHQSAEAKQPSPLSEGLILPAQRTFTANFLEMPSFRRCHTFLLSAGSLTRWTDEVARYREAQLLERNPKSLLYTVQVDQCTRLVNKRPINHESAVLVQSNTFPGGCAWGDTMSTSAVSQSTVAELCKAWDNYASGNQMGHFVPLYAWADWLWSLAGILVSGLRSRGHFWLWVYVLCYPLRNAISLKMSPELKAFCKV